MLWMEFASAIVLLCIINVWHVTIIFDGDDNVKFEQINDVENSAAWIGIRVVVKQLSVCDKCDARCGIVFTIYLFVH